MFKYDGRSTTFKILSNINKYSNYLDLASLFLLGVYGSLTISDFSDLENEWIQDYIKILFDEKFWIALIALGIVTFNKVFYKYYLIKIQPYKFRKDVMYAMLKDLFDDNRDIRITLFKEVGHFKNFIYNIWAYLLFIYNWLGQKSYWEFGNEHYHRHYWGKFIQVHQRAGWEMKESKTKFYYSPNTIHRCEGIAARVIQNYENIERFNLPDIKQVDLNQIDLNDREDPSVNSVRQYMRRSFISNFSTLKNLNSRAQHFLADAVWGNKGPVGVLIIDSLGNNNPFEAVDTSRIDNYINLIGSTFGGNLYDG